MLINPAQLAGSLHVSAGCFLTAGSLVAGVAMWHLMRGRAAGDGEHTAAFRSALKAGAITRSTATSPATCRN